MHKKIDYHFSPLPVIAACDPSMTFRVMRLITVLFAYSGGRESICFPSRETLSRMTGMDVTTVSRASALAQKLGWIEKCGRRGFGQTSTYRMKIPVERINAERAEAGLPPIDINLKKQPRQEREEGDSLPVDNFISEDSETVTYGRFVTDPDVKKEHVISGRNRQIHMCVKQPDLSIDIRRERKEEEKRHTQPATPVATPACASDGAAAPIVSRKAPADRPSSKPRKASSTVPRPDDVPEDVWQAFQTQRRAKRAPVTGIVIDGFRREAAKAGISLETVLRTCCERGWQGFKAEWLNRDGYGRHVAGFDDKDTREAMLRRLESSKSCTVNDLDYNEGMDDDGFIL